MPIFGPKFDFWRFLIFVDLQKNSRKRYLILGNLGHGNYGKVKEALHIVSAEKIAIKVIEKANIKSEVDFERVRREIAILKRVDHPFIIKLYDVSS